MLEDRFKFTMRTMSLLSLKCVARQMICLMIKKEYFFSIADMARDTAVGREHVLIVPSSLTLDVGSAQQAGIAQNDINQQILEVRNRSIKMRHKNIRLNTSHKLESHQFITFSLLCILSSAQKSITLLKKIT